MEWPTSSTITKQFTATAIMQLQEQGKLSVTDRACKFLDDCPDAWKAVTIHHLLSRTSGIPSYTAMPGFSKPQFMRAPLKLLEIVMVSKRKRLDFHGVQPAAGRAWGRPLNESFAGQNGLTRDRSRTRWSGPRSCARPL